MKRDYLLKVIDLVIPVIGIGLMINYTICDTSCSSLTGSLLGVNLEIVGIMVMTALLIITMLSRFATYADAMRSMILAGSIGGEVILVRFQIAHDVYCPDCLAFGICLLILFAANFSKTNRWLSLGAFLAGAIFFAVFFKGTIMLLYV